MSVQHGPHERGAGSGHPSDEDEGHVPVVLVRLPIRSRHVLLGGDHGGRGLRIGVADDPQFDQDGGGEEQPQEPDDGTAGRRPRQATRHRRTNSSLPRPEVVDGTRHSRPLKEKHIFSLLLPCVASLKSETSKAREHVK